MPVEIKYKYSAKVTKGLKNKVSKEIVNAVKSSPEMIKEMRRVCQMANRRAQNIEKGGYISPALGNLGDRKGYSKFNITGMSWEAQKREYCNAVAFLNQPTSSATGCKEFENQMRNAMGIDKERFDAIKHNLMNGYNSAIDRIMSNIPYSEYMQEIYSRAEISAHNEMEREARETEDELEQSIQSNSDNVAGKIEDFFTGFEM